MNSHPKAIVTGATGYIGSHVARYLLTQGWKVSVIIRPASDFGYLENIKDQLGIFRYDGNINSLIDFFQQEQADVVMHIAASVITNPTPQQVPVIIDSNIRFGTEILEAMSKTSTKLFISTGTNWQNYNGSKTYNPVDLYSASKEAFEKIVKYYVEVFGIRHLNLRLFDVYGEDDRRPKLWTLLRDVAVSDKSLDITAGGQIIDMVYIDDIAKAYGKAYEWLITHPDLKNEIYGLSSMDRLLLKDIIILFQSLIGKKLKLNFGARPYKPREVMTPPDHYTNLPNWTPTTSLKVGLGKYLQVL